MWPAGERVGAVIQARMGSTRLPGKALIDLEGTPIIGWVVSRVRALGGIIDGVVLATSTSPGDDPLAAWARRAGVAVFRGDEADVLDRYRRCTDAYGFDAVLRVTGDNPLVCPREGRRLVDRFRRRRRDYITGLTCDGSGLPVGAGLELFGADGLRQSAEKATGSDDREHVNEYLRARPERFDIERVVSLPEHQAPDLSLTIDTASDFERVRGWIRAATGRGHRPPPATPDLPLAQVVAAYRRSRAGAA
ncbi:MAG: NTP transferase domain-containing protein [Myxococcota bacterium]